MKSRLVVHSCNDKGDDGVGNEKDGGGDGGVELEEGDDQGEADNSDQGVGEDEDHALQGLNNVALLLKRSSDLVFCHTFGERKDGYEDPSQLQGDGSGVGVDAKDKDDVETCK